MYYKVKKESEIYAKLMALAVKIQEANEKAIELGEELGGNRTYTEGSNLAGGIGAISFDENPDKLKWMSVGPKHQSLFYPKSKNLDVLAKLKALPTVSYDELNEITCFKRIAGANKKGLFIVKSLGFVKRGKELLLKAYEDIPYNPVEGIEEIKGSEFQEIYKQEDQ